MAILTKGGVRADPWPNDIPNTRAVIDNHSDALAYISCGFLAEHYLGARISGRNTENSVNVRLTRENDGIPVVAEQVASVLMIPRIGIWHIRGDTERDILDEHLHIHVTSIEYTVESELGPYNAQNRYNQVKQAVARLVTLLSEDVPDEMIDSIGAFLEVWGNPDSVRTRELKERLSNLENQLASTYDEYTVDDDIVQFLTGEQSPVYTPPPNQEGATIPPPLPQAAAIIPAKRPAWLVSEDSNATGTGGSSRPRRPRRVRPGRLYVRVVVSVDEYGDPIHIYPMFKHGKFRTSEYQRLSQGYTDLPPRDSNGLELVSEFCAVSGLFQYDFNAEREFSNRLVGAGFRIQQGIGGQSEWHQFTGETNQEIYVELLNAIEVLENFSNEFGVSFERRNILEELELHFGTE